MKKKHLLVKKRPKSKLPLREIKTDKFTLESGHLGVGGGHQIYYERWGNPAATTPIVMFHGGPGGHYKSVYKANFGPERHQLVLFDQRGSGNSLPYGETKNNTTKDLIEDTVKLFDHLKIERANIYGGSWGSTLVLLFAIEHPERVKNVLAAGIFTASQEEIDYIDKGLFQRFYPEVWEKFIASVPSKYAKNPIAYHYQALSGKKASTYKDSAKALEDLESPLLRFDWRGYTSIIPDKDPNAEEYEYDYVPYRIFAHYLSNHCFLADNYILKNAYKIKAPLYLVQGRYDMICPPHTAYKVHKAVKGSKLFMTLSSHDHDPENRSVIKTVIETVF